MEEWHGQGAMHDDRASHAAPLLASIPALSFSDVELLLVVRRHDQALFDYLQRQLIGVRGVEVILERRWGATGGASSSPAWTIGGNGAAPAAEVCTVVRQKTMPRATSSRNRIDAVESTGVGSEAAWPRNRH